MKLGKLLQGIDISRLEADLDMDISGVRYDSRVV